ncbi:5'-nucleotidase, lipoprotein e(P4) family [Nannocystis radixulma]|uniref:HAD family acid phosphatase n=1 Tax=Nannocystis radixulma TaxID=2995305 RepID=A0ABT5B5L4_9BACT|nr:HAD family acid phosphatase [Nannocystis radixulma]MDC0669387.1 HAD family acid phosphatase [Nannocystis radixulma]
MSLLHRLAVALVVSAPVLACKHAPASVDAAANDTLFAVTWVQTSAEYEASALQAYAAAGHTLERALADKSWTAAVEQTGEFAALPPAIIVDVDETVLDNSAYQARLIASGGQFSPDSWNAWIEERKGIAVPGAVELLSAAAAKGVRVFYVSNRDVTQAEATRDNLARLGFPDADDLDTFYFRDKARGWKDKSPRRAEVAKTHRVIFLIGDNLFDFVEKERPSLAERAAMVQDHASWWGSRWFIIPNPMYGSWDEALFGYDSAKSPADKQKARVEALELAQ